MGMCVVPFLPGDAVKIIAASLLARPVRGALYRG
jgi:biotin transporter BioY